MAEVYPGDSVLLNLSCDGETGVEYIETGKAPYYLEFRKLVHRLLEATRRANDFRVFDAGGLNIGVKAGKFWNGLNMCDYAGVSEVTLADNQSHIYVYLDSSGVLITNEYSDWPVATVCHIQLAEISTNGGDITSVIDMRGSHMWFSPAGTDTGKKGGVSTVLTGLREIVGNNIPSGASNGGVLALDTTPVLEFINGDTDSCLRVNWVAGNQDPVVFQVSLPSDLDTNGDVEIHLRVASESTTDVAGFNADSYFNEGDTKVEDSASQTSASATYEELTITIDNTDVPSDAQTLTVELTPQAHTTDDMYLTAIWIEYTKE